MLVYEPLVETVALNPRYHTDVLRLDRLDRELGGNKWFKLKYNLEAASRQGKKQLLTFGGAFSNHIAATAAAGQRFGFATVGVIRGEDDPLNPTLRRARELGMQLHFVTRNTYTQKHQSTLLAQLQQHFGDFYTIPEGGSNLPGIQGCCEILQPHWNYDFVLCACGTASTYCGLLLSAPSHTRVVGLSVLKGNNLLPAQVQQWLQQMGQTELSVQDHVDHDLISSHCITNTYALGGYAAYDPELVTFKRRFEAEFGIPLDHVYTAKLFYGARQLFAHQKFPLGARLLLVHSGGLQGNAGFERRFAAAG